MIAGFLLTAVPNWTGRPVLKGIPLLALFLLWIAGRLTISFSEWTGMLGATLVALAFLPVLAIFVLKELVAASNPTQLQDRRSARAPERAAQMLFHHEIERYGRVEMADRLALAAILILISSRRAHHSGIYRQLAEGEQSGRLPQISPLSISPS